jgi:glycosyltransferase involved in cell wall biosynthesis
MRIVFQENGQSGVFFHRQLVPHIALAEIATGISIERTPDVCKIPEDQLTQYDIFVFHGRVDIHAIQRVKNIGKKIVYDVDDYWYCTSDRHFCNEWKILSHGQIIEGLIKDADLVTCASEELKKYIKKHTGVDAVVLPNGIAESDPQFTPSEIKSERLRFGFIGGSSHVVDIHIIGKAIKKLFYDYPEYRDKWQIVFGGFDTSCERYDQRGNRLPVKQKDIPSVIIERWLTDNYSICEPELRAKFLLLENIESPETRQYVRLWTKDVFEYGSLYNHADVLLAPLRFDTFNKCKSNLKVVEAGWMGKEIIATDIETFKDGITDSNVMLCQDSEDFLGAMLSHLENFISSSEPIRSQLQEKVKENYSAKVIAEKRYDLYKKLLA